MNSMAKVCWPYFDPEYENLSTRINPPRCLPIGLSMKVATLSSFSFFNYFVSFFNCRVSVDNTSCSDCTLIKVMLFIIAINYFASS